MYQHKRHQLEKEKGWHICLYYVWLTIPNQSDRTTRQRQKKIKGYKCSDRIAKTEGGCVCVLVSNNTAKSKEYLEIAHATDDKECIKTQWLHLKRILRDIAAGVYCETHNCDNAERQSRKYTKKRIQKQKMREKEVIIQGDFITKLDFAGNTVNQKNIAASIAEILDASYCPKVINAETFSCHAVIMNNGLQPIPIKTWYVMWLTGQIDN